MAERISQFRVIKAEAAGRCPSCDERTLPGAKFCSNCGTSLLAAAAASRPRTEASGERRHLTIMFCDLVSSTWLASRRDPEDMREVIGSCLRLVTNVVNRFGGYAARYVGDGALVYFGYPLTHEDDAERAIHAG